MLHTLISLLNVASLVNGNVPSYLNFATEAYRDLCPFSRTCAKPPKSEVRALAEYKAPCCQQCSCEKSCMAARSCCPDSEYFKGNTGYAGDLNPTPPTEHKATEPTGTACLTSGWPVKNSHHNGINSILKRYVTVNTCPGTFSNKTVVRMCKRQSAPKTLIELSFVTGSDGQIYRNEYCSFCNGVPRYKRWPMQITCAHHQRLDEQLTANTVKAAECTVWSTEPEDAQIPDNLLCYLPKYNKCNMTGKWSTYNPDIAAACESNQFGVYQNKFYDLYANVFCYLCNKDGAPKDVCSGQGFGWKAFLYPFTALVDLKGPAENDNPRRSRCQANEIYDRYVDVCWKLKCPLLQYASNGICKPLFKKTAGFPVKFCTRLMTSSQTVPSGETDSHVQMVSATKDTLEDFVELSQRSRGKCLVSHWVIRIEPKTSRNFTLVACANMCTSLHCMVPDILFVVDQFENNTIHIANTTFHSEVIPKHPNLAGLVGRNYNGDGTCERIPKYIPYFNRVRCPAINISANDLKSALQNNFILIGANFDTSIVDELNSTTPSGEMFEICVNDYLSMGNSGSKMLPPNYVLLLHGLGLILGFMNM